MLYYGVFCIDKCVVLVVISQYLILAGVLIGHGYGLSVSWGQVRVGISRLNKAATIGGAIMVSFFCEHCRKDTTFFSITRALQITGVCRSTVYYWMEHNWVHWCELPSGRRVICQESLVRQAPKSHASSRFSTKNYSESVRKCATR